MKKILLIVLAAFFSQVNVAMADDSMDALPKTDIPEALEQQIKYKIEAFIDHLYRLNSKYEEESTKDWHIEACMDLLMGRGFDTKDDQGNVIIPASRITVLESNRPSRTYLTKTFLRNCGNISLFRKVKVKSYIAYICELTSKDYVNVTRKIYHYDRNNNRIVCQYGTIKTFRIQISKSNNFDNLKKNDGLHEVLFGDMEIEIIRVE